MLPKSRNLLLVSLALILLIGLVIVLGHRGFTERVTSYTFWLLTVSSIIYIWEVRREK